MSSDGDSGNHTKIILFAIVLGTFMTALDATIVSVALPTMAQELGEEGHDTQNISWVLLIYTLMLCCFVLLWSKLGSNKGYKKVFMAGIAIFFVSSMLIGACGFIEQLGLNIIILLRAVQGIGAGMVTAMSLAMVSSYLPKEIRGSSIGAVTLAASAGTAFGPAIGGILTTFHWSYIFFINVPIGLLCLFLCARYMNVGENRELTDGKLDYVGAGLLFVMIFSLIFYLNQGQDIGWMSEVGIALVVVIMVFAGLVFWWEQRVADPLISLNMIRTTNVRRGCIVAMLLFMAMAGSYLLLPYYLQFVKGYETMEYGFILIANSVGMMAVGPVVGKLADRTGKNKRFVVAGALVCALGFLMMTGFNNDTDLIWILLSLFVMGAGVGMALVASTNLSFDSISEEENGLLSGLTNTFRQAGSSSGVAILNCIFMSGIILSPTVNLIPGFRHAFFIAMIIALLGFVVAMGLKDKPKNAVTED
jgi:EmrB/QacA subfamily drug resistance transporter